MKKLLLSTLVLSCFYAVSAQTTYTYNMQYVLTEKSGSGPALTTQCTGSYSWIGSDIAASAAFHFDKGCGVVYDDASSNLLSGGSYTIELYFKLDTVNGYKKIIDFDNQGKDAGLYNHNKKLTLYPGTSSTDTLFEAGKFCYVALTRDAGTKDVHMYFNNKSIATKNDATDQYIYGADKKLVFFADDNGTNGEEGSGSVAMIRITNQAKDSATIVGGYSGLPAALGINSATVNEEVKIYPNPIADEFHIVSQQYTVYSMRSIIGTTVRIGSLTKGDNLLSTDGLAKGVYLLEVADKYGNSKVFKILKK